MTLRAIRVSVTAKVVASNDNRPDPPQANEDKALLALMSHLPPLQRRILAMLLSRIDQMEDDEDAAVALIERVMTTLKRG